ncbi:DUF2167 domain-containing protein [Variovorax sp. dw_954]|uniref:DUF2167 domain-containing protein n=1 Tax=Variovorax sp. dw_954 TaxID=2720078 RepID=UPI001BD47248|nr:DUF2167 domain-containing protein [Variovorax sp. dw_954]
MRLHPTRLAAGFLLTCAGIAYAAAPAANTSPEAEQEAAYAAAKASRQLGPANIGVSNQAHLQLPAGYVWVPVPAAAQLMRSMGNRVDDSFQGLVFPAEQSGWFASVRFVKEGYIKDDDAKEWNAADLLKSLKEGTEASNEDRVKRGITPMEVVGWAQEPKYDAGTHRLVWSALTRDKGGSTQDQGVNYNTYALGREGYISLNLVTDARDIEKHKPEANKLLGALQYDDGKKYADFNGSTDKVAAYGLAALVAGAAAKKLGLLAVLAAFAAKFAKVIFVAGGAALWGFTKMFRKKEG